jgi:hypothetical protein
VEDVVEGGPSPATLAHDLARAACGKADGPCREFEVLSKHGYRLDSDIDGHTPVSILYDGQRPLAEKHLRELLSPVEPKSANFGR